MLDFDNLTAEPISFPLILDGKKYVLKEPTEDAYSSQIKCYVKEGGDSSSAATLESVHIANMTLLARCLFEVVDNGNQLPVKVDFIRKLPRRVFKALDSKLSEMVKSIEDETEETLTKRIEADTKKLEELRKGNTSAKN